MKKKNYNLSREILEINANLANQAQKLAHSLCPKPSSNLFLSIDCVPNGSLNPFNYGNGLESALLIKELGASFLGPDLFWLGQQILLSQQAEFKTNLNLGVELGMWQKISTTDYAQKINWDEPFCVKNASGITKIWHPLRRHFGYDRSLSTRGNVINFIYAESELYLQPFYLPLTSPNREGRGKMIYRLVFFCGAGKDPEPIGGLWIKRSGFKIYLDKEAVVGLVLNRA